jgi:ATP-dependent Clp protease ATP-binding subunit ClpA
MNSPSASPGRLEHLRHLEAHLAEQIRGQDHVLPRVASVLHRGELGLAPRSRPRGSFLFLGPTVLRDQGFAFAADESVVSFLIQRGFHPRLGARPLRDAVEKYLRGAIADAMLAEECLSAAEFVACGNELLLCPRSTALSAVE